MVRLLATTLLVALAIAAAPSHAINFGVYNATQKPGSSGGGCVGCHDPQGGNIASVVIAGPAVLDAGTSGIYTMTATQVTPADGVKMGINVAAEDSGAALSVVAGQPTVVQNGEITHSTIVGPLNATAVGAASYQFRYTMPNTAGSGTTHTLYGTAALGHTSTVGSSSWQHATNFVVTTGAAASNPPRLVNIATRMQVLNGNDVLIGGFIIGGSASKTVVVRARGPSLVAAGITNALANPNLQLFSGPTEIASNNDWSSASNASAIQASGFAPSDGAESAILTTLAPGAYTAIVSGVGGATGVGIVEVFEVDAVTVPLINIATRGQVLTGNDVMIGGFIIQGTGPQTVVVRARGPSLAAQGVPGTLANPNLQLFSGPTQIASNDNWQGASNAAAIQSSGFAPPDAAESAIMMSLAPGAYTAIVSGVGSTTGVGIVEVFTTTATP